MYNIEDIRNLLIQEIHNNNVKDCGYDCLNGRKYVEVRNVVFECTEDCIFSHIPKLPYMEDDWYKNNYDPIVNPQLSGCIEKLVKNPQSRQAVLIISSVDNIQCTMYMNVSLINKGWYYVLEYSVHMRSNDAVEFRTDYQWHKKLYEYLVFALRGELHKHVERTDIIWCVDSLQLYEQYFEKVMK